MSECRQIDVEVRRGVIGWCAREADSSGLAVGDRCPQNKSRRVLRAQTCLQLSCKDERIIAALDAIQDCSDQGTVDNACRNQTEARQHASGHSRQSCPMNYRAGDCGLDSLCRREVSTGSAVARHPEPGDLRDPDAYQPAQEPPERLLPASGITCGPRIPPRAHF